MAELVCDFDQVKTAGNSLLTAADTYESAINSFSTGIDGDLSQWSGNAKNAFNSSVEAQVSVSKEVCEEARKVGEFIVKAASAIEELDEGLATQSI